MSEKEITTRADIFHYAKEKYGSFPEYPWEKSPNHAVLRHSDNRKWYALVLDIPKSKLGFNSEKIVDILNIKSDTMLIGSLLENGGFFPAYHMNKEKWITILLDGTVPKEEIFNLIDLSFELTMKKTKKFNFLKKK